MNWASLAKRIAFAIVAIITLITIEFWAVFDSPQAIFWRQGFVDDAKEAARMTPEHLSDIERRFGTNRPTHELYLDYLGGLAKLDFGTSMYSYPWPVSERLGVLLANALVALAVLLTASFVAATASGIILSALFAPRPIQKARKCLTFISPLPHLLLTTLLVFVVFHILAWWLESIDYSRFYQIELSLRYPYDYFQFFVFGDVELSPLAQARVDAEMRNAIAGILLVQTSLWFLGFKGLNLPRSTRDFTSWRHRNGMFAGLSVGQFPMPLPTFGRMTLAIIAGYWFISGMYTFENATFYLPGLALDFGLAVRERDYYTTMSIATVVWFTVVLFALVYDAISAWMLSRRVDQSQSAEPTEATVNPNSSND